MPRVALKLAPERSALIVVDMQRYYLEPGSVFSRYFEHIHPGAMDYVEARCRTLVIPNIQRLLKAWRARGSKVLYLRLCGVLPDRTDLHPSFHEVEVRARRLGFEGVYPLQSDPYSDVPESIGPRPEDEVMCKTTYSAFTSSGIEGWLRRHHLETLVFTGLATSQCVETTARDAADRGFQVAHIMDAQADYDESTHRASLYSSQGICGGHIFTTESFLDRLA